MPKNAPNFRLLNAYFVIKHISLARLYAILYKIRTLNAILEKQLYRRVGDPLCSGREADNKDHWNPIVIGIE
jgi:hypothetical protein